MSAFIDYVTTSLEAIIDFINSIADGISILVISLYNTFTSATASFYILPSAIGGIITVSFSLLIVLRLVGR